MAQRTLRDRLNEIDTLCTLTNDEIRLMFPNIKESLLQTYIQRISALYLLILLFEKKYYLSNYSSKEIMNELIDIFLYYDNLKIFNKVGDAYGFLLDIAYVMDPEKKIEFMLSAVIYCNRDGILNDSKYDYDSVGFPFYKNLGQLIYNYELERKKVFLPNFTSFLEVAK